MFQYPASTFVTPEHESHETVVNAERPMAASGLRGLHAQTLANAARRRRAASVAGGGVDGAYWKAGVPSALAKAASLRREPRFRRLP